MKAGIMGLHGQRLIPAPQEAGAGFFSGDPAGTVLSIRGNG